MRALATAWLHTHCDQHSEIMTGIPQLLSFSHSGQDLNKITMNSNFRFLENKRCQVQMIFEMQSRLWYFVAITTS